ncbi:hypothetical protein I5523_08140 [Acinetobacter oleivorans]|uniref:hypothetical protein n=1 Tax=Acinetobacter oleivorans TaxID=1148157 RepID=UPI0018FF2DF3|nr:hypothetical protein [Acinetobacter oleivorans]MBJ9739610.1 hypothetical protein [Acinetobacter oleivorans]
MKVLFPLFFWRLKFYTLTTISLLRRRMQVIIFILLMLAPAATPVFILVRMLASPVLALIHNKDPINALIIWSLILFTFLLWGGVQNKAIRGGGIQVFISTLPISASLLIIVDICFFFVIDIPILLPFLASILTDGGSKESYLNIINQSFLIISFAISGIILQILLLRNIKSMIFFACISFFSPLLMVFYKNPLLAVLPVIFMIYLLFKYYKYFFKKIQFKKKNFNFFTIKKKSLWLVNFIKISLKYLLVVNFGSRLGFIILSLTPFFLWFLFDYNKWKVNVVLGLLIIVINVIIFQISGMTFSLQSLHASMINYWRAEGISKLNIYSGQLLSLIYIGIISCIPLFIVLIFISGFFSVILIFPLILVGISLFFYINRSGESISFIAKVMLGGIITIFAWLSLIGY